MGIECKRFSLYHDPFCVGSVNGSGIKKIQKRQICDAFHEPLYLEPSLYCLSWTSLVCRDVGRYFILVGLQVTNIVILKCIHYKRCAFWIFTLHQSNTFCKIYLTNALSFYWPQNVLGWSKIFVPEQKVIYMLWQSQKFCTRQKYDLHSVNFFFVLALKFLKRH